LEDRLMPSCPLLGSLEFKRENITALPLPPSPTYIITG